jgi:hypothetical protein
MGNNTMGGATHHNDDALTRLNIGVIEIENA